MHISTSELLDCASAAAMAAADHAARNTARRQESIAILRHDVKLCLDVEAQDHAERVIRERFPDHLVLGEESKNAHTAPAPDAYEWIIDPIDGTVNFTHGLPQWCTSIAVRQGSHVLAGVVYAPMARELFTATADGPAAMNGQPISVSSVDHVDQSIVMTGLDKNISSSIPPFAIFHKLATHTQRVRIMGAAALDICHVANGTADAYFESGIYIWDVAAAGLIVQRAGGTAGILHALDSQRLMFLASNGRLHGAVRQLIEEAIKP
jgi:myo-inositol-1(or 4)-monophosphatase